ncbi:MAG TPA: hypothetical protein VHX16_13655 [Chloroflexota bacterium]|nr:hypothetical protein [Chloroflexota bacterium]
MPEYLRDSVLGLVSGQLDGAAEVGGELRLSAAGARVGRAGQGSDGLKAGR